MKRFQPWLLAGASVLALAGSPALAQDDVQSTAPAGYGAPPATAADSRDAAIAALQAQVEALAAQIADLKASTAAGIRDVRSTAAAQPTVSLSNGRPTFSSADGKFTAAIRGVIQFDAAHYDVSPLRTDNDLSSGTNFRRARLGVDGKVFGDFNYALWGEFGGSGGEAPVLNQAYVEYVGWKPAGLANPVRLRIGAWATATGLEDATSNTDSLFLERGASAELVRGLAGGDGRSGVGFFANGDQWYVSGTLTGAVVGVPAAAEFAEQTGYLARVAFNPLHGGDYDVHLGANISGVIDPADTAAGAAVTKQVRLRERPELRVDGTRLIDTGNINSDGARAYGLEAGASFKSLLVTGEYFKVDVSRTGGTSPFDPSFDGWYVQAAWALTGEHRGWNGASGGFRGLRPTDAFNPKTGKWGAFEVAARYSVLDLNDHAGLAGATPAGGIRGGEQKISTVGLNWYPNNTVRFLLDYQWIDVDRLSAAGAQIGEDVNAISLRSQVAF